MKCADRSISPTSFVKHKHSINVEAAYENDGFSFSFYRDTKTGPVTDNVTVNVTDNSAVPQLSTKERIYMFLKEDPTQTREMLAMKVGKTIRTIQRALDKLSEEEKIKRIGSSKTGYWEVL